MNTKQYLEIINAYILSFSKEDNNFKFHSHEFFELLCVIKGKCTINLYNAKFDLSQLQCIFIDSNIKHKLEISDSCVFCCLGFGYSPIKNARSVDLKLLSSNYKQISVGLSQKQSYITFGKAPNICHCVKDLMLEIQKEDSDSDYLIDLLFQRVLIEMSRTLKNKNTKSFCYLNKAKSYISENYNNLISVNVIARVVGLSASYLQFIFKKHLNCSVMEYVNILRLEQSAVLLRHTNKCIIDISTDVGFNSRQQFGRAFKKHFLVSPKNYRSMYKNSYDICITPYEDFKKY